MINTGSNFSPEKLLISKELNRTQITAISIAVICILSIFLSVWLPLRFGQAQVMVRIPSGATLSQISEELKNNGIIKNKYLFMLYATALGEGRNMKAGKYVFDDGDSLTDVVAKISKGLALPDDVAAFIPEGYNVWEIDARLTDLGFVQKGEFARTYLQDEGELFPDTYKINSDNVIYKDANGQMVNGLIDYMKRDAIIKAIGSKMLQNYQKQTLELLKDLTPKKAREIIIIASMLEKEVRGQKDMAIVAGIIYKRLALGMPLQIDATVGYGACLRNFKAADGKINCDVTQIAIGKEIKIDSEYNTYTRKGLPIGPISNPGIASLKAAMNPQKSPYIFYLSTSDGQIIYSKTGWEHVSNRAKYMGL